MIKKIVDFIFNRKEIELGEDQLYKHKDNPIKLHRVVTKVLSDEKYEYVLFNDYGRPKSKKQIGCIDHLKENYELALKTSGLCTKNIRRLV